MPHSNYKYGDKREDGYIFSGYSIKRGKKYEDFRSPEAFERQKEYHKINKKNCRFLHKGVPL